MLESNKWQEWVMRLLRLRYTHLDLVEIPDAVKGDCGIEAFTRDGCCYQCYGVEGEPSAQERYKRNRKKITDDIRKFRLNHNQLQQFFGSTKIRRWVLVIPKHDNKKLVAHAEKKAKEIRALNLPYAAPDFEIHIITDDYFEQERNTLLSGGHAKVQLELPEVEPTSVEAFSKANSSQISDLENKLAKLKGTEQKRERLKALMLRYYLRGENALSRLRQYPELFEQVNNCRMNRTDYVEAQSLISRDDPNHTLSQTIKGFQDELSKAAPGLDNAAAELLAYATTAGWLLECPLNFPDDES